MLSQSLHVPCPQCGLSIQNDGSLGGQEAVCPNCQHRFQMPIVPQAADAVQPAIPQGNEVPAFVSQPATGGQSRVRRRPQLSSLAVKSLLIAIPGLLCFPLGIVSIVLGLQAYGRIKNKRYHETGEGIALTGIGLGAASIVIIAIFVAVSPHDDTANPTTPDWREVDASSEATRQALRLVEAKLQSDLRESLSSNPTVTGTGGVRVNVLERVMPDMTPPQATRIQGQRYEVSGDFLWELRYGALDRSLTPPTAWSRGEFAGIVVQTDREKWSFETVQIDKGK
jgi:hypothetical protein